ncbi:phenylacetate--CoA ligase family protein [Chloroflexota bacterium]
MRHKLSPEELAGLYDPSKERMPPEERAKWLDGRLAKQVQFAYENAPAAKEKLDKAGVSPSDIRAVKDLEKLPVTTKDELVKLQTEKPPFGGYLVGSINSLSRVYVSPGPIYDAWGEERVLHSASGMAARGIVCPGDIVLVSTAYHMVPAGLFVTDALDMLGCTVVPAGVGQTDLQVKLLYDLQAQGMFSFPSFVMAVLKRAEEMGYDVKKNLNLKYIQGGGERHIQVLKKSFVEDYGLEVLDGYGTADLGSVAADCGQSLGYHYEDEICLIEIVDPETGKQVAPLEEGEVVVTLFSQVYPLIRFGTGDLASYTDEVCPCGRTTPRITRILGMIGDHIRVKGMFVHLRELDEAISKFPEITKSQMVLRLEDKRDRITLCLEVGEGADKAALTEAVTRTCKDVFKLTMDKIEFLERGTLPEDYKRFLDERWG